MVGGRTGDVAGADGLGLVVGACGDGLVVAVKSEGADQDAIK